MASGCSASTQLMAKMLKSTNKKTMKQTCTCPICIEKIVDASKETDGDDSILCEGICASWLLRKCWLSKDVFAKIGDPNISFHCPRFRIDKLERQLSMQEESISTVKSSLQQEVTTLKIELTS